MDGWMDERFRWSGADRKKDDSLKTNEANRERHYCVLPSCAMMLLELGANRLTASEFLQKSNTALAELVRDTDGRERPKLGTRAIELVRDTDTGSVNELTRSECAAFEGCGCGNCCVL